ncbi:C40 family peptidase [Sphingobium sp. AP49]|uniref:C40 family peptidase n=1 Tax=Sphingobium sp. AP49 TaxID=1144307 RepID=UPI00026EDB12|nr:C40 family peptidase [Sphingobium sp. AP49]WHO40511.1 C40 family peptidase [Sphingobium sp. AP49]
MSGGTKAAAIVAAARALLGVPFRLHGRDPALGLDCVGLVERALAGAGHVRTAPHAYGLRWRDSVRAEAWLSAAGLERIEAGQPGDVTLVRPGPLHLHLMIGVPGGFIHAHAGLRRVVETPGPPPWPVIGFWRA